MQKITPHLWFDNQAEAAVQFYTSVFPNSKIGRITRYDEASAQVSGQAVGSVLTVEFKLVGQQFAGLNGGPQFHFNPSISFHVKCATKNEVDEFWDKLSDDGDILMPLGEYPFSERYGWCNDRYGVSWQVIFAGASEIRQRITPVLMFVGDVCGNAEEAVNFYGSVFADANATVAARYGKGEAPDKEGAVRYAHFTLEGQEFGAMDSAQAHDFAFNEAISFLVHCEDQQEVDYFWKKLTADGGEESMCGWLKDRYGVSWQIVPQQLTEMLNAEDKEKALQATKAMLQMKKIDIATLQKAFNGG